MTSIGALANGTGGLLRNNGAGVFSYDNSTYLTSAVTSLSGTANQVSVSAATGAVTLSLPQSINTTNSPTFAGLTLSGLNTAGIVTNTAGGVLGTTSVLTVANGGTGQTTLTAHGVLIGNGAGALNATSAGNSGQVLLSGGALADPAWANQSTLSVGSATNLSAGTAMSIPYQSSAGTTAYLAASGTAGQVLTSNGTGSVPTWTTVASLGSLSKYALPCMNSGATGLINSNMWSDGTKVKMTTVAPNAAGDFTYNFEIVGTFKTDKIYHSSDARFKKNINTLDNALGNVLKMRGVSYEWRKDEFPNKNFSDGTQIGLIAQEVEKVYPELVNTAADGYKAVEYSNLVAVLIEAVKEQQKLIDQQTKEISALKAENSQTKAELEKNSNVQNQIDAMKKQIAGLQDLLKMIQPSASAK